MKIYLAGPVVSDIALTKSQMNSLYDRLLKEFPKEDIYRPGLHKVPNEWGITMEMWGQCVFTMDVIAIDNADCIVLCNFGRNGASAGTAWECGYAFAKNKKILVGNMPGSENSSLMVIGCAANVVEYDEFVGSMDINKYFVERGKLKFAKKLD